MRIARLLAWKVETTPTWQLFQATFQNLFSSDRSCPSTEIKNGARSILARIADNAFRWFDWPASLYRSFESPKPLGGYMTTLPTLARAISWPIPGNSLVSGKGPMTYSWNGFKWGRVAQASISVAWKGWPLSNGKALVRAIGRFVSVNLNPRLRIRHILTRRQRWIFDNRNMLADGKKSMTIPETVRIAQTISSR